MPFFACCLDSFLKFYDLVEFSRGSKAFAQKNLIFTIAIYKHFGLCSRTLARLCVLVRKVHSYFSL